MVSRNVRRFVIAIEVMALGAALVVGAGLAGGSIASAAEQVSEQPAGSVLMAPPDCITIIGCTNPPVFEPTPTPTCATRFCQIVDVGTLEDLEVAPVDPEPTPCPTVIACTDVVGPTDGGVLDPGDNTPPTATPEPTEEPEEAAPEATPTPTEEPVPTQPPAATPTGQGNNGNGNGGGNNGNAGSQGNGPAAPQGGQQTTGNVPLDGDEDDEDGATSDGKDGADDEADETEADESVQVVDEDGSGMGLLGVILVAVGVAVPASAGAFFLARRQKTAQG